MPQNVDADIRRLSALRVFADKSRRAGHWLNPLLDFERSVLAEQESFSIEVVRSIAYL